MSNQIQDGWEQENTVDRFDHSDAVNKFVAKEKPLGILTSTKHSLQPDMLFGWKPKLPSCPLLLKFPNPQTQKIINLLKHDDRFRIAYKGKHFVSSVQVNQQYPYHWKYRNRYSLNLALIQQAAKQQSFSYPEQVNQQKCQYSFDSNFQSGNLDLAVRVKANEYDCFIRSDSNTKGHCNWYYFSVKNGHRIGETKINICNIGKINNLYSKGMRPYVDQSMQGESQPRNENWTQQPCQQVQFVQRLCRYGSQTKRFQLQFKYTFSKPQQQVYFAYGIPYTYSKLERLIKQISTPQNKSILAVQKLCESLGGLNIPLLRITGDAQNQMQIQTHKRAILVSARIHPGQSHASYLMEGVIKELLGMGQDSKVLRQMFVFYIVPMINVDGVVVGNYRTSYSGKDLNRQFKDLNNFVFPQITKIHELALQVRQKHLKGIEFYLDFHGHSQKKDMFAYGPDHSPRSIYFFKSRIFPKIIEDIHPIFSYKKSNFKISQGKKKTARAHMLWKLKIPMVYTFEVSNGMYQTKSKQDILLNKQILLQAGQSIMKGLFKYARLEMKLPTKLLQKNITHQNIKKRVVRSSKALRDISIVGKRKGSKLKQIGNIQFLSQKFFIDRKRRILSKMQENKQQVDITQRQQHEVNDQMHENLEQFMSLVKQIKNTKMQNNGEGGSDSESQCDDFDKEDTDKLFKNIHNQKLLKQIKTTNKKTRVLKSQKSRPKRNANQQSVNIFNQIKKQLKMYKNNQLQELIKQTKKLNNHMSYVTLPSNKTHTLQKSPSIADRLSKIGARFSNYGLGVRDNYPVQKQKVIKVPITQKTFNLQI